MRRISRLLAVIMAVGAFQSATAARAQFGQSPVHVVFPFAPGGGADAVARIVAERIAGATGQSAYVDNITGASGHIGIKAVKDAKPDGTTLLFIPNSPMVLHQHFFGDRLIFDPFKDFAPVTQIAVTENSLAVSAHTPVHDLPELIAWLKQDPKRASYGTAGAGAMGHFLGLEFGRVNGIAMEHVPYRGTPLALNDAAAGQIPIVAGNTADFAPQHNAGMIRIIGTFTEKRSAFVTCVPTMREQGFGLVADGWFALFAPARTPPEVVAKINAIVAEAVHEPAMRERFLKLGVAASGTTSKELGDIHRRDTDFWGPIVKASGFKPEE